MDKSISTPCVDLDDGIVASDYALKNLNKSLGEAQAEYSPSLKSEENKWGGYMYTPLSAIVAATRLALAKHHLTVSQFPVTDLERKTVTMITRLVHWDSGEWLQHTFELPGELALGKDGALKFNQQTIGGSITYAQKYAYKSILGAPDSEELIDSTEEKGDLPSHSKAKPAPAAKPPDSARLKFFTKAKEYGWGLREIKAQLSAMYPEFNGSTSSLSDEQIEASLNHMANNKPSPAAQPEEEKL